MHVSRALALFALIFCGTLMLRVTAAAERSDPAYLGSEACRTCHETAYTQWQRSLHLRMTKPVAEATVRGEFSSGTRFADHGRTYEFGRKDGKPFVRIAFGDAKPETFRVDYVLGFKRYQGYLSTLPDGRLYVLPSFWHVESKRWLDWKDLAPIPDDAHGLRQIWNINCFNCHATNLAQGYDVRTSTYRTTWTEMGIGCEACHGPGGEHVALMNTLAKDRTLKPPFDVKIFAPRRSSAREVFDTCAYCHGNKLNVFTGFRPGSKYEDYALPFLMSAPIPETDLQGEFWPDGRPNRFNRPQAVMQSGCFQSGQLACTNCHAAHGSTNPFSLKVDISQGRKGDELCTQCHDAPAFGVPALETHTFHKANSDGSRCINCHMSDVNWRLLMRRRDHTFNAPVPEMTARFGVPNACTTCHDDRSPEWAAVQMDRWWGDAERRTRVVAVAGTMYRAGSRDASAAPDLARLVVDRSTNAFLRASAAEYLSRFLADAKGESRTPLVSALIGAASDPEAVVRAVAVRGLGVAGDEPRVVSPLVARLIDAARVVRVRAAESLLALGKVQLPGAAGTALARAQEEYLASLQAFPDNASNHAAIAWLEAQRGRLPEAEAAAEDALKVDARYARPWVIKGVIAARKGEYADAIEAWKKARSLEPSYPNLDRLIDEAKKSRK